MRTSVQRKMVVDEGSVDSVRRVPRARSDTTPAIFNDCRPPSHIPNIVMNSSSLHVIRTSFSYCLSQIASHPCSTLPLARYCYWNSFYSRDGDIAREATNTTADHQRVKR